MSAPAVLVDFRVGGLEDVARAVGSVQQSLDRLARSSGTAAQRSARERVSSEQTVSRETERLAKYRERVQEQSLRLEQRMREQAARGEVRAAEQAARELERVERAKSRTVEREAVARTRAVERAAQAEQRAAAETARAQERHARAMGTRGAGMVTAGVGRVMGLAGNIAGMAAAVGGGFTLVDAIQASHRREAAAGQIVRSAAENRSGLTKGDLLAKARAAHVGFGVGVDDALAGIDSFIRKNGSLSATTEMLPELAGLAAASGATMEDLGTTAGDIYNKTGSAAKTKAALRMIAAQGKAGAIDVRDLGEYGPRLTAAAGLYSGDVVQNIGKMSALAQFAVSSGSAHNARVGTESALTVASDLAKHDSEIQQKLGINVWADKDHTMLAPAEDTIAKMVAKAKGSQSTLLDLVGAESMHAVRAFSNTYSRAGGGAAGEAAMRKAFSSIAAPTLSDSEVGAGVADKLSENAAQMDQAVEKVRASFERFAPAAVQVADAFARVAPAVARALEWLTSSWEHALAGVGAAMAAAVTVEVGKAALASVLEQAIARALAGQATGNVVGGLVGGAGGVGGVGGALTRGGALGTAARLAGAAGLVVGGAAALTYGGVKAVEALDEGGHMPAAYYAKQAKDLDAAEAGRKAGAMRELAGFAGTIGNPFGVASPGPAAPSSAGGSAPGNAQHAQLDGAAKKIGGAASEAEKLSTALASATDAANRAAQAFQNVGTRPPQGF